MRASEPPDHSPAEAKPDARPLLALGRYDAGESALVEGHRVLQAEFGEPHPRAKPAADRMRELFARSGRSDQAPAVTP